MMTGTLTRATATALLVIWTTTAAFAVGGKNAAYFGGTANVFAGAKDPVEGRLNTTDEEYLVLTAEEGAFKGTELKIRYKDITELEYGQKAGRRVGAAIGTAVLLGPLGLVTLFSKKRKHFITVSYRDAAGKDQAAVLELGKDIIRTTLTIVETRSGKEIQVQDEEARKASRGGN
jgi:hypothetical protein